MTDDEIIAALSEQAADADRSRAAWEILNPHARKNLALLQDWHALLAMLGGDERRRVEEILTAE